MLSIRQTGATVGVFFLTATGLLLRAVFDVALKMVYLFTGASGIIFAYVLYRTKLIPRPIAVLGVIGYPVLLAGAILYVFNLVDLFQEVALTIVSLPVGLFELILPIWLIFKGFAYEPSRTDDSAASTTSCLGAGI